MKGQGLRRVRIIWRFVKFAFLLLLLLVLAPVLLLCFLARYGLYRLFMYRELRACGMPGWAIRALHRRRATGPAGGCA